MLSSLARYASYFGIGSAMKFNGKFLKQTDDQYFAVWGASSKILGRVRLDDGLIVLGKKTSHVRFSLMFFSLVVETMLMRVFI